MNKNRFVPFYFICLSVVALLGIVQYWGDGGGTMIAIALGLFLALLLISVVGYVKNNRSMLWSGLIGISMFSVYILFGIGALVWAFWTDVMPAIPAFPFVFLFLLILGVNVYTFYHLKERIWALT